MTGNRSIPRARPYYNLVKAVIIQSIKDKKPLKGRMADFIIDCYWELKKLVHMQEEDFNLSKRMSSDPEVITQYSKQNKE